MRLRKRG
jgi:hypothetical protein